MDQNRNWVGASRAPNSLERGQGHHDQLLTLRGQYMINHVRGGDGRVPQLPSNAHDDRGWNCVPGRQIYSSTITDMGDMMIEGMYAGFSPDTSTGVIFGIKLPIGNYTGPFLPPCQSADGNNDPTYYRDSLPGSGSTDLLFGAYHDGTLAPDGKLAHFTQARFEMAVIERAAVTGT